MMKWGRKKKAPSSANSSSSSHSHLISHVFPLSWLSKFKQTSSKPTSEIPKNNPKSKQNSQKSNFSSRSPKYSTYRDNRFYTHYDDDDDDDDDGFWRLSFDEGNIEGDKNNGRSKGIVNTGWRNTENELIVPPPYCGNCKTSVKQVAVKKNRSQKSNKRHGETPRMKEVKDERLERTYRRIIEATSELQRELDEVKDGCRKSVEKEINKEVELLKVMQMLGKANNNQIPPCSGLDRFHQQLKDVKVKELGQKSEKQRKSFHIQSKVRVRSPRTPEVCKIKSADNLKRAKMKKKIVKEGAVEEDKDKATVLGSYAVVKRSIDPQTDFRDSMLEMIMEKKIRRPQELEELLACYLTLNAEEYHDLIIKVFRQVWCELEDAYFNQKSSEDA